MSPDEVLKRKALLFLKKKKQKDFSTFSGSGAAPGTPNEEIKVFWFSFSKENNLRASSHEGSQKVHDTLSLPMREARESAS